jgi:hypothetical protein
LTQHVRLAIEPSDIDIAHPDYSTAGLPARSAQTARDGPGVLIEDILARVDHLVFDCE